LERVEEESRQMEMQMGVIKVENEVLKGRLEETMEELQEVRMHGVELLEQFDSRAVEEVQHDIDDIKQW
jgi:phage/plasmid-associated DNA primase